MLPRGRNPIVVKPLHGLDDVEGRGGLIAKVSEHLERVYNVHTMGGAPLADLLLEGLGQLLGDLFDQEAIGGAGFAELPVDVLEDVACHRGDFAVREYRTANRDRGGLYKVRNPYLVNRRGSRARCGSSP